MQSPPQQLTLGITPGSDFGFRHFHVSGNEDAVAVIRQAATGTQFVYLWGERGSGKTHLSHAACRLAAEAGRRVALLPLAEAARWRAEVLEGRETFDLVAIDDIDAVAGQADWERALFALYNGLRDSGRSLLVTAARPPAGLELELADLRSRLGAMLVYQLHSLDDDGRLRALALKAQARGMDLSDEVGRYLLARVSRDMHDLAALLDRLDRASLAHQRKLTVPFVREQLQSS